MEDKLLERLLKGKTSSLDQMKADYEAAESRREAASEAWGDAILAEAEGGRVETATMNRLERELDRAVVEATRKRAAYGAATARAAKLATETKVNENRVLWDKALSLAEARTEAAERLAELSEAYAGAYFALVAANHALVEILPRDVDRDAGLLRDPDVEIVVRKDLFRLGIDWAFSWPWGRVSIPELMAPLKDAERCVKQWASAALAAKG